MRCTNKTERAIVAAVPAHNVADQAWHDIRNVHAGMPVTLSCKEIVRSACRTGLSEARLPARCQGTEPAELAAPLNVIRAMKFVHIVEINDPLNPLIEPLTREQLWRGLVLRAESPRMFVPYLDACTITDRFENGLSRELVYGPLTVRDAVTFAPQHRIAFDVPEQKDIPASSLVMTIEEPQPDWLHVRFEYDDGNGEPESSEDAFYNSYRKSAYQESDIDTVRIIRELAREGRFDAPLM